MIEVITGETNSPYGTNTRKTNVPTQSTLNEVFPSAVITEVQMGKTGLTDRMERCERILRVSCVYSLVQLIRMKINFDYSIFRH
jgi:hypothetical protein